MTVQDISTIRRFIGVVEGVAFSLPEAARSLLYDYIAVVDVILDREEEKRCDGETDNEIGHAP